MPTQIAQVEALFRYPVKSMRGEALDVVDLGWHGLDGDRRLAFHRGLGERGGFPWLTASRLPELVLYTPLRREAAAGGLPTHVRTPAGEELELFSPELAAEVSRRLGAPVEMMHLNRGIFDEASVSIITTATVEEVSRLAATPPDVRRYRPNILLQLDRAVPFGEDEWVGGSLRFGESDGAVVGITNRDERCAMVSFDPDSARTHAELLKTIVRLRDNKAGLYGTVIRRGRLAVGQGVFLEQAAEAQHTQREYNS